MTSRRVTILKIGGELLEAEADLRAMVAQIRALAGEGPLVVVHGGGRELTAELARRGVTPRMIDGVRVTDEHALAAAVSVLGGTINTRLVAALQAEGVRAVGLTGVDGAVLPARRAAPRLSRAGEMVDLGHVGEPLADGQPALLDRLCEGGWIPVVASLGVTLEGNILNVNADVAAAHLAIVLAARRLIVLGGTNGVLDADGSTIPRLSREAAVKLVESGTARNGMAAKLDACARASSFGVEDVRIVDGRARNVFTGGTRIVPYEGARIS